MTQAQPQVEFEPEGHIYRVGGRQLTSVSHVLEWGGVKPRFMGGGRDPAFYTERGHAAHLAMRLDLEGRLDESSVCDVVQPYLHAGRGFCAATGLVPQALELQLYDEALGVAGTLDVLGLLPLLKNAEGAWLLDWKMGVKEAWHKVQTAAYAHLYGRRDLNRGTVYLSEDGSHHLERHTDPADYNAFMGAIGVANWRRRNRLID